MLFFNILLDLLVNLLYLIQILASIPAIISILFINPSILLFIITIIILMLMLTTIKWLLLHISLHLKNLLLINPNLRLHLAELLYRRPGLYKLLNLRPSLRIEQKLLIIDQTTLPFLLTRILINTVRHFYFSIFILSIANSPFTTYIIFSYQLI